MMAACFHFSRSDALSVEKRAASSRCIPVRSFNPLSGKEPDPAIPASMGSSTGAAAWRIIGTGVRARSTVVAGLGMPAKEPAVVNDNRGTSCPLGIPPRVFPKVDNDGAEPLALCCGGICICPRVSTPARSEMRSPPGASRESARRAVRGDALRQLAKGGCGVPVGKAGSHADRVRGEELRQAPTGGGGVPERSVGTTPGEPGPGMLPTTIIGPGRAPFAGGRNWIEGTVPCWRRCCIAVESHKCPCSGPDS
mmetsp:Transcript_45012/g.101970  ORF Transcript_45012/g.101970 Transcript_45012/m.101970 type:complete len:252 (-) Transcript_45012:11-766(-)